MKIVTLTEQQFQEYSTKHKYRSYFQSIAYGKAMTQLGYDAQLLGFVSNNNNLVGASLIIYKKVFMNNKIAYAPRGILYDYDNLENVKELATALKKHLSKQGFMLLKMDPYIPLTIRNREADIINFNNKGNTIIDNLEKVGFTYKGKNLFFENEHSRFEGIIMLDKNITDIFNNFDKKTRNKIRKSINSGITVYKDETKKIGRLYEMATKKNNMPANYFNQLKLNFKDDLEIYYAKIDTSTFIINSRRKYEREQAINSELAYELQDTNKNIKQKESLLNKKMQSDKLINTYKNTLIKATDMLKKYPKGIIIAGAMVIKYDNAAYIIEDTIDEDYSQLDGGYLLKWRMIEDYKKENLKYININAVVGELERKNKYSGLNEYKLSFNSIITEYIGEFEIVLNNFAYKMYQNFGK